MTKDESVIQFTPNEAKQLVEQLKAAHAQETEALKRRLRTMEINDVTYKKNQQGLTEQVVELQATLLAAQTRVMELQAKLLAIREAAS